MHSSQHAGTGHATFTKSAGAVMVTPSRPAGAAVGGEEGAARGQASGLSAPAAPAMQLQHALDGACSAPSRRCLQHAAVARHGSPGADARA